MAEAPPLPIGLCAQVACILDVAAPKPGNVSLQTPFPEMSYLDFLLSAAAIGPAMEQAPFRRVGDTILESIRATRRVANANTNLGIVLLLAPLAAVPANRDLRGGVMSVLLRSDVADARAMYEAIRLAQPGGLGRVAEQDVAGEPTVTLREAMALAANRDMVARQYVNDFEQVFDGFEFLRGELAEFPNRLVKAVTRLHMRFLSTYPDSLIARQFGAEAAAEVMREAQRVWGAYAKGDPYPLGWFGDWLIRSGRNPGTTADLVTASLFVALRSGIIQVPLPLPFHLPDR
jgi:triphosphoribosyl-dephospho-CoA synthase